MNKHLQQRVETLFNAYDTAILATCEQSGPQISRVPYRVHDLKPVLFITHGSDHLFNLTAQPGLVLLTPGWKLVGQGETASPAPFKPPHTWQTAVMIRPGRLHILSDDGQHAIETIDF